MYWYIIIILFPLLGGIAYFIFHFANREKQRRELEDKEYIPERKQESITRVEPLEQAVELSGTISNKLRLADAYMENQQYEKAVKLYEECKEQYFDDEEINLKLIQGYYHSGDYLSTIVLGRKLIDENYFKNSKERVLFAWSFFELHDDDNAEKNFELLNIEGSNFYHRKEYVKFLLEIEENVRARELSELLQEEIKMMSSYERRIHRESIAELRALKVELYR